MSRRRIWIINDGHLMAHFETTCWFVVKDGAEMQVVEGPFDTKVEARSILPAYALAGKVAGYKIAKLKSRFEFKEAVKNK